MRLDCCHWCHPSRLSYGAWCSALLVLLLALLLFLADLGKGKALNRALNSIVPAMEIHRVPCAQWVSQQPVVVLALGQSNAGNHGSPSDGEANPVGLPVAITDGVHCVMAVDPLPGSTGQGGSIWLRLSRRLTSISPQRLWVFSVMGVDSSSMSDWTDEGSPLRHRLEQRLASLRKQGLAPDLVLWQQGEADARLRSSAESYTQGLEQLKVILDRAGSSAPLLVGLSTVCRSIPNAAIRGAIRAKVRTDERFKLGPDTDSLRGERFRSDGCHFSARGLMRSALRWARAIEHHFPQGFP
jgi:hypothetical protein